MQTAAPEPARHAPKPPIHRRFALAVALAALLATSACSNAVLTDAATLSQKGRAAATAAAESTSVSVDQFAAYADSDAFIHGFAGGPATGPLADEIRNQKELTARANLFASLARLYASFGALAGHDASARFQADLTNVFANINAYQQAVHQPQANGPLVKLVPPVAGAIAGLTQSRMILAANQALRIQLANAIAVMADPLVRAQFVDTKQMIVRQLGRTARLLLQRGLLSPKPYLDAMGRPLGLTAADDATAILARDKQARAGLAAIVDTRLQAAVDAVPASYDASLKALRALLPLHDRLAAERPLDLTELDQAVQTLQAIAAAAAPAGQGAGK